MTTTGGYLATGGVKIDRGDASAGGTTGNGGSARDGGIILPDVGILLPDVAILRDGPAGDGLNAQGTPAILPDGYVKLNTGTVVMAGHISSYESGSGSSIMLTYVTNSFCASGTVAADNTYNSWAGAGFNVNQAESGASGSSSSLVLTGSSVSITYLNRASSSLEFQMYDGSNYWCSYLPPAPKSTTVTIPFSGLSTQCWTSGGQVFTSGTPITAVQLVVGGSASTPTPFDFCFQGLTVH